MSVSMSRSIELLSSESGSGAVVAMVEELMKVVAVAAVAAADYLLLVWVVQNSRPASVVIGFVVASTALLGLAFLCWRP